VKKYADISGSISKAIGEFKKDVVEEKFPSPAHSFSIKEEELKKLE
jgi:ketopantoate hydroxymethyltransferase